VLLDEALVDFADAQPADASLALLERHTHLLVFRSFSKAWGLAGLRVGYVIGAEGAGELLAELEPDLGVSELSQAGAHEALHSCLDILAGRKAAICGQRPRVTAALTELGFEVDPSQANFVWATHPAVSGAELAARLAQTGVLVAAGDALGEPNHVRIALRSEQASDRLLDAVAKSL
jgi:histidinol-phosphate aminotransferase